MLLVKSKLSDSREFPVFLSRVLTGGDEEY